MVDGFKGRMRCPHHFGGLMSRGWHTVCVVMRELVDNYLAASAALASPGIDELRWQRPVRPGDSLHVRDVVLPSGMTTGDARGARVEVRRVGHARDVDDGRVGQGPGGEGAQLGAGLRVGASHASKD